MKTNANHPAASEAACSPEHFQFPPVKRRAGWTPFTGGEATSGGTIRLVSDHRLHLIASRWRLSTLATASRYCCIVCMACSTNLMRSPLILAACSS
jgi:hypothetical protein